MMCRHTLWCPEPLKFECLYLMFVLRKNHPKMLLLFLMQVSSTLFSIDNAKTVESALRLKGQTVVLMQTKLFYRPSAKQQWREADANQESVGLSIYKSAEEYEYTEPEPRNLVFKDVKQELASTFFYTTPETSHYTMVFSLDTKTSGEFALELAIYEGRPWTPEIISGTDYQVEWLTRKMGDLLYFAKSNFDLQRLDEQDEVEYVNLYNNIFKLINRVVILKIVVIFVTLLYINKKTKEFYLSKKILRK